MFRITKTVHNNLQGVAKPDERITADDKKTLTDWIKDNATRYWLSEGGPLRDPSEGGADVIIVGTPVTLESLLHDSNSIRLMIRKCLVSSP